MRANSLDRRQFLAGSLVGGLSLAAGPAGAIEPIVRTGKPQFKFSLAAYSYRDLLQGKKATMTLDEFVLACAQMGLDGTELTSYYFPDPVTPEYLRALKQSCFRLGLDVSGTAVGNDFCVPAGPQREEQMALVKRWVDYAEILGAPVIRIFSGNQKPGQSAEEAHRLAVQGMEEACDYAGQHGICLALENHGGLTETAEGALALVRDVKSPWFGFNLDTGNFHGSDVYADLEKLAPYAVNVQIKVVVSPAGGKRQPSDFGRLAQMLKQSGYRGYIVLEYEEDEDPRVACPRFVDQLREAFRV